VGLRSLRGDKIISIFLTVIKIIAVILHVLSEDGWKKKPKKAEFFYSLNKIIMVTELKIYFMFYYIQRVRRWRSWLRHCYTRGKVAGSIPDGVLGIIFIYIILGLLKL
jgi:hypothetical protein